MIYKYEQDILDKGIWYKKDNIEYEPYPKHILDAKKEDGYGIYQHPKQLSHLLTLLEDTPINSYVEIGVWRCGTFRYISEWIHRKNPKAICIGIDITAPPVTIPSVANRYLVLGNSKGMDTYRSVQRLLNGTLDIDLCLIDASHQYANVKNDWDMYGQFANYCLFHDIAAPHVPDVRTFWEREIKPEFQTLELLDYYFGRVPHFGIGVVIRE